nr:hypothetical protein [Deltaproteobacteria bacterium]
MQITLDGHPQYVRLAVGHREPAPGERQVEAEREFRALLDRAAREPSGLRRLRALLCEVDTRIDRRASSEEVVASLGRCINRGRVTLWAVPQPERFTDLTTAPAEDELEPLIQDPEPELSRVAFQVLEQHSGAPIGGVALSVTLPDGSVRELETDDDGLIDIRDIP